MQKPDIMEIVLNITLKKDKGERRKHFPIYEKRFR